MITPNGYDTLGSAQDDLMRRLMDGAIPTKRLPAAHAAHVRALIAAGCGYDEASTLFWDAVRVAMDERAREASL